MNPGFRGEPFSDDAAFDWAGNVRKPNDDSDFFGFSNKARQVEKDLGCR